jgi:hypothetical protein
MAEPASLAERRPHLRVLDLAFGEFRRLIGAIFVDHALGLPVAPGCSLRIEPSLAQLSLIIHGDLTGLELANLQELCGQNLDVRYHEGELEVFCPSLAALSESRHAPPGERFRDACR